MKQGNGRTRGLALGLLAALMVMGLSGTAMAKSWRGGPTDKWHEKHWGYHQVFPTETTPPENPPTEEELAVIGYYQKTPVVNVENQDAVASILSFFREALIKGRRMCKFFLVEPKLADNTLKINRLSRKIQTKSSSTMLL